MEEVTIRISELEEEFNKNDIDYIQIRKSETGYIYKRVWHPGTENEYYDYEVFKRMKHIINHLDFRQKGEKFSDYDYFIIYPGNGDFGKWAWSYNNLEMAMEKFKSI